MSSCTSRGAAAARGGSDAATADGSRDACTAETARARGATGSQAPMISEAVGPGLTTAGGLPIRAAASASAGSLGQDLDIFPSK